MQHFKTNMNNFAFNGRSRQTNMRFAHDHRPTRDSLLNEAHKRHQKREEQMKRDKCARKIQCAVQGWRACQYMVRCAVEEIFSLKDDSDTVCVNIPSPPSWANTPSDAVGKTEHAYLHRLERLCCCFNFIRRHQHILPVSLMSTPGCFTNASSVERFDALGSEGGEEGVEAASVVKPAILGKLERAAGQARVLRHCSAVISSAVHQLVYRESCAGFTATRYMSSRLLSHVVYILLEVAPATDDESMDEGGMRSHSLETLRDLAMAVATTCSAEAMESVLCECLRVCAMELRRQPVTRQAVCRLLSAALALFARQDNRVLTLVSSEWAVACWACLCASYPEEYLALSANPLAVLLSTEESVEENGSDVHLVFSAPEYLGMGARLIQAIVRVAYSRLVLFSAYTGSLEGSFPAAQEGERNLGQEPSMAVLGHLTRLLPYFLQHTSDDGGGVFSPESLTHFFFPMQKAWLTCVGALSERLCPTDFFVQSILFDLHHSRISATSSTSLNQKSKLPAARLSACGRCRNLISYLFSSMGGLQLLEKLVVNLDTCESHLPSFLSLQQQSTHSDFPGVEAVNALEILCSVYAWPLYTFMLSSPAHRLETAAVFAKLVRTPQLIRRLWQLYWRGCEGLSDLLPPGEKLHGLCCRAATPYQPVRIAHWARAPPELLAEAGLQSQREVFYDPHPALSTLFFTLLSYYVDATDFIDSLQEQSTLSQPECWSLIFALKEIVHRSHFFGVLPSTNSEAVAHLAFILLTKLHTVNEAHSFVPYPSLWVSTTETRAITALGNVTADAWETFAQQHAALQRALERRADGSPPSSNSDEDLSSGESLSVVQRGNRKVARRRRPGDDLLFKHSCEWGADARSMYVLLHAPFLFPFPERAALLTMLLIRQSPERIPGMPQTFVAHRGRVFVDAFERFKDHPDSPEMVAVRFANNQNELEEGYGHGVYREFMVSICNEGFAIEHGLFWQTEDGMVYPNPFSYEATGDSAHLQKICFLGAMVGRALRDGILQDVPFAQHFRNFLLGRRNSINNLKSFDNQLYRQLLSLTRLSEEEIGTMGLTFTCMSGALGITREIELIKGGSNVIINSQNCLHYVHLVADFKLNREGASQAHAFKHGLETIIQPSWLQFFDSNELLNLFGGDQCGKIDIVDWKKHTVYQKPEDVSSLPVRLFWEVVESLTNDQQRLLLKFATSMNRPPLLGFQFLSPPFNVHLLPPSTIGRLPSASTCFSMFKLPPYTDYATLRAKILAAIEGTNTFDLS